MADYSKFDQLADEIEQEEQAEKQRLREERRQKFEKEQNEKKAKWRQDMIAKGENPDDHIHKSSCGCGFADPDELKRLEEERKNGPPPLSLEEKNVKKMKAVEATREHGNLLFKEGKYDHAFAVYERGIMIINGTYGVSDEDQNRLNELELMLDLNMAATRLKQERWTEAIDQCKMALQLDKQSVKAMYRIGQAYVGMGDYDEAREWFEKALAAEPTNKATHKQLADVRRLKQRQVDRQRAADRAMQRRMQGLDLGASGEEENKKTADGEKTTAAAKAAPAAKAEAVTLGEGATLEELDAKLAAFESERERLLRERDELAAQTARREADATTQNGHGHSHGDGSGGHGHSHGGAPCHGHG